MRILRYFSVHEIDIVNVVKKYKRYGQWKYILLMTKDFITDECKISIPRVTVKLKHDPVT